MTEKESVLDKISLNGIKAQAIIGTFPEERIKPQRIIADIDIFCDLSAAGKSDDLADTIDYFEFEERLHQIISTSNCFLLEKLAGSLADAVLSDNRVSSCRIRLRKPCAMKYSDPVEIEITRSRKDD